MYNTLQSMFCNNESCDVKVLEELQTMLKTYQDAVAHMEMSIKIGESPRTSRVALEKYQGFVKRTEGLIESYITALRAPYLVSPIEDEFYYLETGKSLCKVHLEGNMSHYKQ